MPQTHEGYNVLSVPALSFSGLFFGTFSESPTFLLFLFLKKTERNLKLKCGVRPNKPTPYL